MTKKYTCPCCGYKTLDCDGHYEICPICFWEDDSSQTMYPYSEGGANKVSLVEAQKNYISYGASEREWTKNVRKANQKDRRNPDWKPIKTDELYELKLACKRFIEGNYSIAELQHNLSWIEVSKGIANLVKEAENELEMIRFCSRDYKQRQEALEVVHKLLQQLNIKIEDC